MAAKKKTYEQLRDELREIVDKLADEKLTLDEMMKLYDKGSKLATQCHDMLAEYTKRIDAETATDDAE